MCIKIVGNMVIDIILLIRVGNLICFIDIYNTVPQNTNT